MAKRSSKKAPPSRKIAAKVKSSATNKRSAKKSGAAKSNSRAKSSRSVKARGRARVGRSSSTKVEKPKVGSLSSSNARNGRPLMRGMKLGRNKGADSRGGDARAQMPVTIPDAVPTDGRPRKNQAGLHMRELEHFRDLLLAKRRELVGDMSSMEREALRSSGGSNLSTLPIHMADMGTDNYEQEFTLGLVEKERNLLREINSALAKIQNGTYGLCEGTGKPISKPRLEAQPWARFSIEYARQMERGMLR